MNEIIKLKLTVPGFVGETENNQTFKDYFDSIEEKFNENYKRFLEVDDDIFKIIETEFPSVK